MMRLQPSQTYLPQLLLNLESRLKAFGQPIGLLVVAEPLAMIAATQNQEPAELLQLLVGWILSPDYARHSIGDR